MSTPKKILGHATFRGDLIVTLGSGKRGNRNRTVTISRNVLEDHEPVGDRTQLVQSVLDEIIAAQNAS